MSSYDWAKYSQRPPPPKPDRVSVPNVLKEVGPSDVDEKLRDEFTTLQAEHPSKRPVSDQEGQGAYLANDFVLPTKSVAAFVALPETRLSKSVERFLQEQPRVRTDGQAPTLFEVRRAMQMKHTLSARPTTFKKAQRSTHYPPTKAAVPREKATNPPPKDAVEQWYRQNKIAM